MGTACAWPVARWARGTLRSSAALFWVPHLVPRKEGDPVCCPSAKRVDQVAYSRGTGTRHVPAETQLSLHSIPAVTHRSRHRGHRDHCDSSESALGPARPGGPGQGRRVYPSPSDNWNFRVKLNWRGK